MQKLKDFASNELKNKTAGTKWTQVMKEISFDNKTIQAANKNKIQKYQMVINICVLLRGLASKNYY